MATVTDFQSKVTTYAYDDAGRLTTMSYPNGVVATHAYDNADRLTGVTNAKAGTFSSVAYTLDSVGNLTQAVVTGGGAGTHSYSLDSLYRVTSVTYPGPTTDTYTYDQLGNRLTKNATSYTYDNADQLTAAGGTSYAYDANGNQVTRGGDTFTWDHENRLTQSVVGGVTSSSVYYGNGVRRSHTVNGVTTSYVYDVGGSLPLVLQDGTNTLVYGLDLISSTDGGGNQVYYSYDGLGSVTDLTDGTGTVTDTYSYDIFGAVRARTGTSTSPWKYTGEQEDGASGDSGYYFLRARYIDTATGRFISRDPVPFDQRYRYAGANPVLLVDRDGREADSTGGAYDASGAGPLGQPEGAFGGLSYSPQTIRGDVSLSAERLDHIVQGHTLGGSEIGTTAGGDANSFFFTDVDLVDLVSASSKDTGYLQRASCGARPTFARIVYSDAPVGMTQEEGVWQLTWKYTVVTNDANQVITAFPGVPRLP